MDPIKKGSVLEIAASVEEVLQKLNTVSATLIDVDPPVSVDVARTGRKEATAAPMFPIMGAANYQQLPNPLVGVLKALPEVDGLDELKLIDFFTQLFKLTGFPGVTSDFVLRIIFPYCRNPLAELLARDTSRGVTLGSFHVEALDAFIPGRLRQQLRQKLFYRIQAPDEFVARIKEAAKVLRIPAAEQEVVQVILEGVTPEERSRLVFAGRPSCFGDLDRLCVMSQTIQAIDDSRASPVRRERYPPSRS